MYTLYSVHLVYSTDLEPVLFKIPNIYEESPPPPKFFYQLKSEECMNAGIPF